MLCKRTSPLTPFPITSVKKDFVIWESRCVKDQKGPLNFVFPKFSCGG